MLKTFAQTALGLTLIHAPKSFAQGFGTQETQLTDPVGRDILPGGQLLQDDIKTSTIFIKVVPFVVRWLIGLAVALAVLALVVGGYQMMTAYGNTEKRQAATKTITWALIGLVLAITAFGIVSLITRITFS